MIVLLLCVQYVLFVLKIEPDHSHIPGSCGFQNCSKEKIKKKSEKSVSTLNRLFNLDEDLRSTVEKFEKEQRKQRAMNLRERRKKEG